MAIIVPENYHIKEALQKRRVHCITEGAAQHQDIRPLRIGILNVMPKAESYEYHLLFPLGRSIIQIEPVWLRLHDHVYKSSNHSHLDSLYMTFEDAVRNRGFDGLILTGAPVESIKFTDVSYWRELVEIFNYAQDNIASTLGICWGGLALAYYKGIDKVMYDKKLFGIYPTKNLDRSHRITGELDDVFWTPQSRHSGIRDKDLEDAAREKRLHLLAYGEETGYTIFESCDRRFVMHLGHPEYQTERLADEYYRDLEKGRSDVEPPVHYDLQNPVNQWRSHSLEFFLQWIKSVYLDTPYEI